MADVTPSDVWALMQQSMTLSEQSNVTFGAVTETPDEIVVTDTVITARLDDGRDPVTVTATLPELKITDRGDGTVEMIYAEVSPIRIDLGDDGDGFGMNLVQTNVRYIVSGDPDLMNYATSGDAMALTLTDLDVPKETVTGDASIVFTGLTGNTVMTGSQGAIEGYSGDLNIGAVTFDIAFEDKTDQTGFQMKGAMDSFVVNADMTISDLVAFASGNPAALLTAGSFSGRYSVGSTSFDMNANFGRGENFAITYSDAGTGFDFKLGDGLIDYDVFVDGMALSALVPDMLPFPIDASLGRLATKFAVPVKKNLEAPFEMDITLIDLALGDALWNLFDAGQILPRDPMTLDMQFSGMAIPYTNILDPMATAKMGPGAALGEITSVTIDALKLDALGVTAQGEGGFTFDWTDFNTIPGMARPEGSASLSATGVNALMDKLIAMGLMTAEDAMGARMMMAMFAQPGETEDSRSTQVEVLNNGNVLVNGQRLR